MSLQRIGSPGEGKKGGSYILNRLDGEKMTLPGTNEAIRLYASQNQTDNRISVFGWDGLSGEQGFHYHKITHDAFLITEGQLLIFVGDESRILSPGDFASAPPGTIHNPCPFGPLTKAIPLISPADWVDYFRLIKDDYDGLMFPEDDKQHQLRTIIARLPEDDNWMEKLDIYPTNPPIPRPEPLPWSEKDHVLPEGPEPYFLQANRGPRWLLGGVTSRPFITTKQSSGRFAISSIESSSIYGGSVFDSKVTFPNVDHVLVLLDGILDVTTHDDKPVTVYPGEVVFLAKGTPFSLSFKMKYTRFYSYADGDGIESIVHAAGDLYPKQALPDQASRVDEKRVREVAKTLGIQWEVKSVDNPPKI